MSNDKRLQVRLSVAVLTCAVCAVLYSWGGVEMKWLRRFVMPVVFFASAFGLTRSWRVFISLPFSMLGISLGYGAETVWMKAVKRSYCGVITGLAFSQCLIYGFLIMVLSIVLGIFNPFPARVEEMILGLVYSSAIFLYVEERNAST